MFNKPSESHLSKSVYAVIDGENYYLKIDETEIKMPDGYYIIEDDQEGNFCIRRNNIVKYMKIKKFSPLEKSKPQVILSGSVFIYGASGNRYEIFQDNDLFKVKMNGELNTLIKFERLDMAIKFIYLNVKN